MLAYELYCENKNTKQDSGRGIPIKKIFINNNNITLDNKPIQEYGDDTKSSIIIQFLKERFNMPVDTTPSLNIPNKVVASNSPKPYITIPGYLKVYAKKDQITGELTLGDKKKGYFARLSIPDFEQEIIPSDISLKIDSKNYMIGDSTLYDVYCKNDILQNDKLTAALFENIATKFFEYIISMNVDFPKGKTSFLLYILPNNDKIIHIQQDTNKSTVNEIDSFGNPVIKYPDSPTTGVFFISYDDKAFTINCNEKEQFYQSIGIGKESHEKLFLPNNKVMTIAGFNWYFLDIKNSDRVFPKINKGIYDQLYYNYTKLKETKDVIKTLAQLNVICIKKTNAKLEVMLTENLSMSKLKHIFGDVHPDQIPPHAFEQLIIRKGQSVIFRYYMLAIKSLLNQTPFDPDLLIKLFTDKIHDEIRDWVTRDNKHEPNDFFNRSEFCRKSLNSETLSDDNMDANAIFAHSIGAMTRTYINFRKENKLDNNSLRDILSKPKYDISTLQFVIKQIGRGIHLLNIDKIKYEYILDKISKLTPNDDVDSDSNKDLSYYFYMGYFRGVQK